MERKKIITLMAGQKRVYAKAPKKTAKKPRMSKAIYPRSDLGPELKYLDTSATGTFNYSGGSPGIVLLNGVSAGTNNINRVGRKILMKSLEMRIQFVKGGATGASTCVRMLIVYDKQTNQALPAFSDVLAVAGDNLDPFKSRNIENTERFIVLCDELINFASVASIDPSTWSAKKFLYFQLPVRFDSNSGGIADITTGSLLLMFLDNNTGAAATTCSYSSRVKWTDL